jgi:hypothetical protein
MQLKARWNHRGEMSLREVWLIASLGIAHAIVMWFSW